MRKHDHLLPQYHAFRALYTGIDAFYSFSKVKLYLIINEVIVTSCLMISFYEIIFQTSTQSIWQMNKEVINYESNYQ